MTDHFDTPMLDLRHIHKQMIRGDILAIITWNRHTAAGCLVLLPAIRRGAERPIPCIVDEANAWRWSDTIGEIHHQEEVASLFAAALGLPPSPKSIGRVMGIIRDLVDDLANIPPMPTDAEVHVADAFARNLETGEEIHQEIRAHV